MKKIISFLPLIFLLLALCSCGKVDEKLLLGTWREKDANEEDYTVYDFYSEDHVKVTYYNYGIAYAEADCYYKISDGNKLTVANEDGYNQIYEIKLSENKLTVDTGSEKMKMSRYESDYNKDENIFGEWKDAETGETYHFLEDYEGFAYNYESGGMYFAYSTKGSTLYFEALYNSSLIAPIEYKIENDKMTFSYDGEIYATLERVEK
jgi:hypothetical protein